MENVGFAWRVRNHVNSRVYYEWLISGLTGKILTVWILLSLLSLFSFSFRLNQDVFDQLDRHFRYVGFFIVVDSRLDCFLRDIA